MEQPPLLDTTRRQHIRDTFPRPFLKWAGGKGQLLNQLFERLNTAGDFHRYHEPFVGGGALFFGLARQKLLPRKGAFISDTNPNLIEAYQMVKADVEGLIERLLEHAGHHDKDYFYEVRAHVPDTPMDRAARIVYLNKTCFNGLYRENSKGQFNVPFGRYTNPNICDKKNLRAVSEALQSADIGVRGFDAVLEHAEKGDFVYFDPPYDPVSGTAYFTAYAKDGFTRDDQKRLAEVFTELANRGVKVMLSNSSTPFINDLYAKYTIDEILAKRNVNSKADRRGPVAEVLVHNF